MPEHEKVHISLKVLPVSTPASMMLGHVCDFLAKQGRHQLAPALTSPGVWPSAGAVTHPHPRPARGVAQPASPVVTPLHLAVLPALTRLLSSLLPA